MRRFARPLPRTICAAVLGLLLNVPVPSRGAVALPTVPPEQRGDMAMERMGHHTAGNLRTRFWNYGMIGDFPPDPLNVDLSVFHSLEAPAGSGMNHTAGITPFVLARLTQASGETVYIMETGYRERQGLSPLYDRTMRLEPRPGYFQADPAINPALSPAMSDDPRTWPPYWPDKLGDPTDPGWAGSWSGYFGKGAIADQESYCVVDDQYYDAWPDLVPDLRDPSRRGLALKIEMRGLQWSDPLVRDVIFCHYDVTNEGTTQYADNLIFGFYMDSEVGSYRISCDGISESDDDNAGWELAQAQNLAYTWDRFGHGVDLSGSCGTTGYAGLAFLQTPGNPLDGLDNDRDGATDERQDGGPRTLLGDREAMRAYFIAHYDTSAFQAYYGRLEDRPAYVAGWWWTGDEDMDWDVASDDVGADGRPGTQDSGEGDQIASPGEPNFDGADLHESDQLGLTGFKMSRIRAGQGNPDPTTDNIIFYTDAQEWPRRLWEHFTAAEPAARFDAPVTANYNIAFLCASGPFRLDVGQTQRFSVALAYAPDLAGLRQTAKTAETVHQGDYRLLTVDVAAPAGPAPAGPVLLGNHPNPFRDETRIRFALPEGGRAGLQVFDLRGRLVAAQDLGALAPGPQVARLDAAEMAPGLYLYRVLVVGPDGASRFAPAGKLILMK